MEVEKAGSAQQIRFVLHTARSGVSLVELEKRPKEDEVFLFYHVILGIPTDTSEESCGFVMTWKDLKSVLESGNISDVVYG